MGTLYFAAGSLVANRFEIGKPAGSGGMGTVYHARDRCSGEAVALKLLHASSGKAGEVARFAREAQILSEQRHPGIVAHVAHGQTEDGQDFLAMEWLEGEDLGQYLARGPLPLRDSLRLVSQVAEALALAHRQGVIHRDLKPSNLFLVGGEVGRVKVLDFGIARRGTASHAMTRTGMIVGTPEYMAPEQARGVRELTPAADVFSLGCILYECLTGQPPFAADHLTAVLARILFDEPTPLGECRLGIPEPVAALVGRLLAKDPAQRPADAAALLAELAAVGEVPALALTVVSPAPPSANFGENEQSLFSVVLAALPEVDASLDATLRPIDLLPDSERQALRQSLQTLAVAVDFLASGALLVTVPALGSATDQATRAARAALLIKDGWSEAVVVMATGRGAIKGRTAVGEVVELAARSLKRGSKPSSHKVSSGVVLDMLSAKLLEGRFVQTPQPEGALLLYEERDVDASRPLLGKPTQCVGRETELAILEAQLRASIEDAEARVMLVTAPSGVGKSRLRHELMRRLEKRGEPITCLIGRGDLMSAGAPYGILRDALLKLCGLSGSEPLPIQRERLRVRVAQHVPVADQDRVVLFVGELCNVPFPEAGQPMLQAARQEPKIMGDCLRRALLDWLVAECAAAPVMLVFDDLQWGDELTVELVNEVLRNQAVGPLFVLAFARPEIHETFPRLRRSHHVQELPLKGLSKKACERLILQVLGKDVLPESIARAIEQSAGNALFLEELIRAVGEGTSGDKPETVVAMLQARIGRFDHGVRQAVRAASVFGLAFFGGGVAELLGTAKEPSSRAEVDRQLQALVDAEVIEQYPGSRLAAEKEYGFRHALVREAAYGLLTESDLITGHRRAARYLERLGELDPLVLAGHYHRGGEPARTVPLYMRAADAASRMWALPEARQHYATAYAVLAELPELAEHQRCKVDVLLRLVQLGILADPIAQSLARLAEARSLLRLLRASGQAQVEDAQRADRVVLFSGRLHYYLGDSAQAISYYEQLLPVAEARGDERLLAILAQSIGAAFTLQGKAGTGIPWLARAVASEGLLESDYERLRASSTYAASLVLCGRYREGMALHDQVMLLSAADQRTSGRALAQMNYTISLRWTGDFAALLENAQLTLALVHKSGDYLFLHSALTLLSWACSSHNQHREALAYRSQAKQLVQERGGSAILEDWFIAGDAEMALRTGATEQAIAIAAAAVPAFRLAERLLGLGLAEQIWGLALGYRDLSQSEEADSHLAAALEIMETSEQRLGAAILRLEWAQLCLCRNDLARAAALRAQGVAQFETSGCAHLIEGVERRCIIG